MPPPRSRPNLDPDAPDDENEEGEAMDAEDDDSGMMAMMGLNGFGSTKACLFSLILQKLFTISIGKACSW